MPAPLNCWTLFESDIETADISRLSRIALNKDFDRNDLFMGTLIKKSEWQSLVFISKKEDFMELEKHTA